ncbi:MAG: FolB domain-containing protein [Candidatus Omnitrophica bacterium]|nr:FolB domain-containing protein [Candidatus Omnitrophota bacterium]
MKTIVSIHIRDLALKAVIGTEERERKNAQELVLNIFFEYDASLAVQTDALGHAVDYQALVQKIKGKIEQSKYFLIERLGQDVLELMMADARILSAKVIIDKPQALAEARSVAVQMSINREGSSKAAISTTRCY